MSEREEKFNVGELWKDREGNVVLIKTTNYEEDGEDYPIFGRYIETIESDPHGLLDTTESFTKEGEFFIDNTIAENPVGGGWDLVERVLEGNILIPGTKYKIIYYQFADDAMPKSYSGVTSMDETEENVLDRFKLEYDPARIVSFGLVNLID